jgi:hypothetical protein
MNILNIKSISNIFLYIEETKNQSWYVYDGYFCKYDSEEDLKKELT